MQVAGRDGLVCRRLEGSTRHLFTTRGWPLGGSANGDAGEGWAVLAGAMGVEPGRLVRLRQVHGAEVVVGRGGEQRWTAAPDGDVIVTNDPDIAVAIQAADCVALLLGDRRTGAVAAAHAGWRGLAAGVPRVAVEALAREFGSRPADLVAAAGPSIGACCYEVGHDVRNHYERAGFQPSQLARWFHVQPQPAPGNQSMAGITSDPRPGRWFFDTWVSTREQLETAGVPAEQIFISGLCTASHPELLCSYRRDGAACGWIVGAIRAIRTEPGS